jgi:hypothetical protein
MTERNNSVCGPEALSKTSQATSSHTALELWQGNRLVLRLPADAVEFQHWPPGYRRGSVSTSINTA